MDKTATGGKKEKGCEHKYIIPIKFVEGWSFPSQVHSAPSRCYRATEFLCLDCRERLSKIKQKRI